MKNEFFMLTDTIPDDPNEFVRTSRKNLGLSQSGLARAIGCTTNSISQYEQGRRRPQNSICKHITLLLEIQGSRLGTKYGI